MNSYTLTPTMTIILQLISINPETLSAQFSPTFDPSGKNLML